MRPHTRAPARTERSVPMKKTLTVAPRDSFMHMAEGVVYKQAPGWYGADSRALRMNVIRKSACGPRPTIVWITGGAWLQVSKNVHVPEMVHLVEAGFTVATVEYRPGPEAPFPAQIEDVKAAIRYLRANAERWCVDPKRIGVMGESAGGHLAALAGTTGETREFDVGDFLGESSAVQCVCEWYGPADLTELDRGASLSPVSLLIGCDAASDPEKARRASPIAYAGEKAPPFLILHGTNDKLVPFSQSEKLYEKLTSSGCDATLVALAGAEHGDTHFVTDEVRALIRDFFSTHLRG